MTADLVIVAVQADDPISLAGVTSRLRTQPGLRLLHHSAPDNDVESEKPDVVVLVVDKVDEPARRQMRFIKRSQRARCLLVPSGLDERALVEAAECGVTGIVRRSDATVHKLISAVLKVARGGGVLPEDLVSQLMGTVARLQSEVLGPRGLHAGGLSEREVEVLRLATQGLEAPEITDKMGDSEHTIKHATAAVIARLHLRNRTHAVAYALESGLI
ncbi:helix-turn-helix transcriptional regulator [Streptomyces hydrogenans]|uniref:helix-turn-helix transcriptional regulator n=1 Tax=Streptomyces hydrogenans TaxID=1873719 RepID=UPI0035D65E62